MGRVIELNGTPFAREGSTRPQHVDPKHEQYGPETMLHAIQGGMYALQAADKLTAPLVKRLHGALEPELPENRTDEFGLKKTGAEVPVAGQPGVQPVAQPGEFPPSVAHEGRQLPISNDFPGRKDLEALQASVPWKAEPGAPAQFGDARAQAARQALGVPSEQDRHSFESQSAQRTLGQADRTVQHAPAQMEQNQESEADYLRRAAASTAMGAPLPPRAALQSPRTQLPPGAVLTPIEANITANKAEQTTTVPQAAVQTATQSSPYAEKLKSITDIPRLEDALKKLPKDDPRYKDIQKRIYDLASDNLFHPVPEKSNFRIDPNHAYHWNELKNLAQQMAVGGSTEADRHNLMQAFHRSEGYGVPIEGISDWISGEHVDRAGDELAKLLHSAVPKKTPAEESMEQAYKTAMANAAGLRAGAAVENADTNRDIKPTAAAARTVTAKAAADRAATDEAFRLGTGTKAVEGAPEHGQLGVNQATLDERVQHESYGEGIQSRNLDQLETYRKALAKASLIRAAKAGHHAAARGLSPGQVLTHETHEVEKFHDEENKRLQKDIDQNEDTLKKAKATPKAGDEPDPDMDPQGHSKWSAAKQKKQAADDAADAAKTANEKLEALRTTNAEEKEKALGDVARRHGVGHYTPKKGGNAPAQPTQPATPAPVAPAAPAQKPDASKLWE